MEDEYFCGICRLAGEDIWDFVNLEFSVNNTKRDVSLLVADLNNYGNTSDEIMATFKNRLDNCQSCKQEYEEIVRLDRNLRRAFYRAKGIH